MTHKAENSKVKLNGSFYQIAHLEKMVARYPQLLDSNRELKAAFIELYNFVQGAEMKQTDEMYEAIIKAKEAINNAKNI